MQGITIGILAGQGWILALHTWTKQTSMVTTPTIEQSIVNLF